MEKKSIILIILALLILIIYITITIIKIRKTCKNNNNLDYFEAYKLSFNREPKVYRNTLFIDLINIPISYIVFLIFRSINKSK